MSQFLILDCMFFGLGLNLLCFPPHSKKVLIVGFIQAFLLFVYSERERERERERDGVVS